MWCVVAYAATPTPSIACGIVLAAEALHSGHRLGRVPGSDSQMAERIPVTADPRPYPSTVNAANRRTNSLAALTGSAMDAEALTEFGPPTKYVA